MQSTIAKTLAGVAACAALALGGSAIAGAAGTSTTTTTTAASPTATPAAGAPPAGARPAGRHVGANGKQEQALSASDAAKVKAAALAKVPGATIERVETDVDHGSPFEAHMTKSDGTRLEVLVDKDFNVTAVNTMQHP